MGQVQATGRESARPVVRALAPALGPVLVKAQAREQVLAQVRAWALVDFLRAFAMTRCPRGSRRSSAPNCSKESYVCYE